MIIKTKKSFKAIFNKINKKFRKLLIKMIHNSNKIKLNQVKFF